MLDIQGTNNGAYCLSLFLIRGCNSNESGISSLGVKDVIDKTHHKTCCAFICYNYYVYLSGAGGVSDFLSSDVVVVASTGAEEDDASVGGVLGFGDFSVTCGADFTYIIHGKAVKKVLLRNYLTL